MVGVRPLTSIDALRKDHPVESLTEVIRNGLVSPEEGVSDASDIQMRCCDYQSLRVEDSSVRLIFTDPLYHDTHLGDWGELASWAS